MQQQVKRSKLNAQKQLALQESKKLPKTSRIFQPFRAIGHVTSSVPFYMQARGSEHFLTVSVGSAFQIYDISRLHLKFVSSTLPESIHALACDGDLTYAAFGKCVSKFYRAKLVETMQFNHSIRLLKTFGQHLLVVCADNRLHVVSASTGDAKKMEMYAEFQNTAGSFDICAMLHPSTYVNKILLASRQGTMQLWNVLSGKMLYEFSSLGSPIVCLQQSPVVDVVAIGLQDGGIALHNIRTDEPLMRFDQTGPVTAISFRTDDHPIMATSGISGKIALWDLESRQLSHTMQEPHDAMIPSLEFLNGQPILVTTGADNAVKVWLFDGLDGAPRLLRMRSGHHAPPTQIRFYDTEGRFLLSSARDRSMRFFSIFRDEQNVELSQGQLAKKASILNKKMEELKLPYPVDFAASTAKERDWDNILSCHLNSPVARTWSLDRKAIGNHQLNSKDGSNIKAVHISACGNFGVVGCVSGAIDVFNMQSGIHRRHIDAHSKPITGLSSDSMNRKIISASIDGTLRISDFITGDQLHVTNLYSPINKMCFQQDNNLVAVVADDLGIRVIDIDTFKTVREFWGHEGRLTDLTFSPDGRWLMSASLDGTVRTWDLPSGCLVDVMKPAALVTSLSFSPSGEFLATTHVNSQGIFLWANRLQFTNVSLRRLADDVNDIETIALPSVVGATISETTDTSSETVDFHYTTPEQLSASMITMSLESKSVWQNLLNLDAIKKRNKPKEAPKEPERAPFFLPTLPGLTPKFVPEEKISYDAQSRLINIKNMNMDTEFGKLLRSGWSTKNYNQFMKHAKSLSPASFDFEVRSLSLENNCEQLVQLLDALLTLMKTYQNFELLQSYVTVALRTHGDIIGENMDVFDRPLKDLLAVMECGWTRVDVLFQKSLCLIDFIRNK